MSVIELLNEKLHAMPEDRLWQVLSYVETIEKALPPSEQEEGDYSEYWNQFIGVAADWEWEESPELPYEKRESW